MTTTVSGSSITFNDNTTQNTSAYGGGFAFRNRIINGDMRIDQRNAGASVTPANAPGSTYMTDRWRIYITQNSKFTVQQNYGSVTPPAGFTNYLGYYVASAYTPSVSTDEFFHNQKIEGYNIADFAWGTANAKTVTLSFWVRSSLTGTFGGFFRNDAGDRNYIFSYTISSANTWEQKTITVTGCIDGTWQSTTSAGISLGFSLGANSTQLTSSTNTWLSGTSYSGPSTQTNIVSNAGATWYITGVQLEKGSTATSFDYRPYGTELSLCQRYFQLCQSGIGRWTNTGASAAIVSPFYVGSMRTGPTASLQGTVKVENYAGVDPTVSSITSIANAYPNGSEYVNLSLTGGTNTTVIGYVAQMYVTSSTSGVALSAEL